jgi:competence protein ComEC
VVLQEKKQNWFRKQLFHSGQFLVELLRRSIPGRQESGIAEALLIGYKQDLDPEIVQSYSNTGVVHIIAISGLHLGLIYWLLLLLLKPLNQSKKTRWLHAALVIAGLWIFSFLAGAQPSVLRSALMFSCMVLGNSVSRKSPAINSLAVSAFILLCYNPFWLWDAGFQLSYAAVLSILLFNQPVYNWFFVKNKLLDYAWKMNAVTIAAQLLTLPVSLYLFHQFPVSFLFSNFIAVPLSSLLLLGEIFLCLTAFYAPLADFTGKAIAAGIRLMNAWIQRVEQLPFSVWEGIQLSSTQAIWLTFMLLTASYWLMEKSKIAFGAALFFLLLFAAERFSSFRTASMQQKIIVYHVPRLRAIDFIHQRNFWFTGDSSLQQNQLARNFHLKPSRVLHRVSETNRLNGLLHYEYYYRFGEKNIICLDTAISYTSPADSIRPVIDLLVLSGNPKLYLKRLAAVLDIRQLVIDGSVPARKAGFWKKDADSLHIPVHDTGEKGAFVMSLN